MELPNGDSDLTMLAENVFDDILDRIKNSRLNFHVKISPFSAYISLKKSLQKDRSGAVMVPSLDCNEVKKLSSENMKLKSDLEKTHAELVSTSLRLKALESTLIVKSESKIIETDILKIQAENRILRYNNAELSKNINLQQNYQAYYYSSHFDKDTRRTQHTELPQAEVQDDKDSRNLKTGGHIQCCHLEEESGLKEPPSSKIMVS